MAGLGPEGSQGVWTAHLAQGCAAPPAWSPPLWSLAPAGYLQGLGGHLPRIIQQIQLPCSTRCLSHRLSLKLCREMVEFFAKASPSPALKHQGYSPCKVPGTRKHPQPTRGHCTGQHGAKQRGPQGAPGFIHEWLSLGLLWGESQALGHGVETGPRNPQCPMSAASRRANLWWAEGFSRKKRRGSVGQRFLARVPCTPCKGSLGFRGAVALTSLCQDLAADLGMGHCSPAQSGCLQCIFLTYQLPLPAPSSLIGDAGEQPPGGLTSHRHSAHHGPSAGLATTVGQELGGCMPHRGTPATFIITPS